MRACCAWTGFRAAPARIAQAGQKLLLLFCLLLISTKVGQSGFLAPSAGFWPFGPPNNIIDGDSELPSEVPDHPASCQCLGLLEGYARHDPSPFALLTSTCTKKAEVSLTPTLIRRAIPWR